MRENLTYGLMRGKRALPSDLLYKFFCRRTLELKSGFDVFNKRC